MPLSIDPTETFFATGRTLFGRILLFFSAGWMGNIIGTIAAAFPTFEHLGNPGESFAEILDAGIIGELLRFSFWPVMIVFTSAKSVPIFLFLVPTTVLIFLLFVYSDEPTPFWWLFLATITSGLPVMDTHVFEKYSMWYGVYKPDWVWLPWFILAFFWFGLFYGMWWAIQKYHSEWIDIVKEIVHRK